jgi:preprotein translocase subunit SecF
VSKQIDFIGMRRTYFVISMALIVIGLIAMVIPGRGLKLGIDFTGGVLLEVRFEKAVTIGAVRDALSTVKLESSQVQMTEGRNTEALIRTKPLTSDELKTMTQALEGKLGKFSVMRQEEVRGTIGRELTQKGLLALLIATIGMIIYITIRFEFKFAITAIIALIHDVLIVLGAWAVLGLEANSTIIATVLTVVGYSINDTIVVFDRIRENLKARRRESLKEVVNLSINQTMTRSLNTSLTTLIAIFAVYVFGGSTIHDFALALIIGITAGTYSSIFIASPLWWMWKLSAEGDASPASEPVATQPAPLTERPAAPTPAVKKRGGKRK